MNIHIECPQAIPVARYLTMLSYCSIHIRTYAIGAFHRCLSKNITHHISDMSRNIFLSRLEMHPIS